MAHKLKKCCWIWVRRRHWDFFLNPMTSAHSSFSYSLEHLRAYCHEYNFELCAVLCSLFKLLLDSDFLLKSPIPFLHLTGIIYFSVPPQLFAHSLSHCGVFMILLKSKIHNYPQPSMDKYRAPLYSLRKVLLGWQLCPLEATEIWRSH
jgi:hypothetical protein